MDATIYSKRFRQTNVKQQMLISRKISEISSIDELKISHYLYEHNPIILYINNTNFCILKYLQDLINTLDNFEDKDRILPFDVQKNL